MFDDVRDAARGGRRWLGALAVSVAVIAAICVGATRTGAASAAQPATPAAPAPTITWDAAHDLSPPLRDMAAGRIPPDEIDDPGGEEDDGPISDPDGGHTNDGALQSTLPAPTIPNTQQNFEGLSNEDNFAIFGGRVNPPDPNGEVGPNNYIEMVNLTFAVYDKSGNRLLGPVDTGTLWDNFAVPDCTDASGDPVVLYDQFTDRWILSQFTTSGMNPDGSFNGLPFYNCVAISQTGDPTGAYYRYAFITSQAGSSSTFFPDYPKYGNWTDSYVLTSRDFGSQDEYGISVYGLEKNKMVNGQPARAAHFFINGNDPELLPLVGDGLLPADVDGKQKPKNDAAIPIVGTQDDNASYGGTFDALNIWDLSVKWRSTPEASLVLKAQLPTAAFDSVFPCAPTSRDCLPQPGITNPDQFLDTLPVLPAAADVPARLPQLQGPRGPGHEPVGRGDPRGRRHALVRDQARGRGVQHPPAGDVRAWRRRPSLDGQHRPGQEGRHGARLQRRQRDDRVPGHPLHRSPRRRPARPDDPRRGDDHRRHRGADDHELTLGRLHRHDGRPDRRLHLLVRQRVLPCLGNLGRHQAVEDPNRELQAAGLLIAA